MHPSKVPVKIDFIDSSEVPSHPVSLPLPTASSFSDSVIKPMALELCAGSAKLSFGLKRAIFPSFQSTMLEINIITIDLADRREAQIVSDLCLSTQPLEVLWAGIPCGTCSRAREIPITIRGHPGAEFPRGLPNLALGINLRYPNANHIYDFVASLTHQLVHSQKIIIIENPRGSWLWECHNLPLCWTSCLLM